MPAQGKKELTTVGVVGVGSIGGVLAEGFDELGYDVLINDQDDEREAELPYPARAKTELAAGCDIVVFAVPTPTAEHGGDPSYVAAALEPFVGTDTVCCLRSTMPPGSTGRLADQSGLDLVYSPEFLRDRSGVEDFFDPDRMVFAGPADARETARELFDHDAIDCETVIETDDYLTAEIGKEAHNAFFATKVSFANQIRAITEHAGGDAETVMDIVTADSRNTTSHLDPMLGPFGGKCLPKDTRALTVFAEHHDAPSTLLRGTLGMNDKAKEDYQNVEIEGTYPNITTRSD